MHTGSVDNNYLTKQAATCIRLAAGIWNDPARAKLLGLAGEYDARRHALRQTGPNVKRARVGLAIWRAIALGSLALMLAFQAPFLRHRRG
jgi:hypothetical protein